jgi:nucleotide-binding universal stress UspA family protein
LVQAWPRIPGEAPDAPADEEPEQWGRRVLERTAVELRTRHPGVEVTVAQMDQPPVEVLTGASREAEMLVLGSRGLGSVKGFLIGSVSQSVLARARCPVVLVRAGVRTEGEHLPASDGRPSAGTPYRDVALALDLRYPCNDLLAFAFESAAVRGAPLRAVHVWSPSTSPGYAVPRLGSVPMSELAAEQGQAFSAVLRPWCEKYPQVQVTEHMVLGSPGQAVVEAAREAGLLVVGRRNRHSVIGVHIGPVTHAVVHHAPCPVAVVPYG